MTKISRRDVTRTLLFGLGASALGACAAESLESTTTPATTPDGGGTTTTTAQAWASGGTAAMTASASYPDPFASAAAGGACMLYVSATEGPCTEAADQVRKDVSEGLGGLPMRLALRVVDAACNPIAGAKVKIWHTQLTGSYSGDTPNPSMCLKTSAEGQKHYMRGVQTTDENGRVDFDSCFPGWYPGRTIHIHFTVTYGSSSTTSQIVFDDGLVDEIFKTHVDYKQYGTPDTHNATDSVVGGGNIAAYTATVSRMSDGAMLAWKQIAVS